VPTRSLSRAVCFPTPLRAAAHGYRSHGGTVLILADRDFRVRSLRLVRSPPAGSGAPDEVLTRLQLGLYRVGTVLTRSAPAFGRAFASCYGSSLLTLRLRSALQLGDAVWRRRPNKEDWRALPGPFSPRRHIAFARPFLADWAFLAVGSARQRGCVLVCAVAAITLWVTALNRGSKHSAILSRLERGFYFAPRRTAPASWQLARSRHRFQRSW